jgi:hypothetical protein
MRARGLIGFSPMRWFSVFAGATMNAEAWPASLRPNLNPDREGDRWSSDIQARTWPGFLLGVRL